MSISFSDFQRMHGAETQGRARKIQSDMIMKETWWEDIQSQTAYLYDMFHDIGDEHFWLHDLHPYDDYNKTAIPVKFIRHASQTYSKDPITFWLQLQPEQECNVDYFEEMYSNKYDNIWPVGLYCDVMDESGKYNKWLVVNTANYNQNQFPTYELLKCDYVFQWIHKGKKYECPGVLRSQNSYNSGLWTDYKIQSVEDQQMFAVPLNQTTETLFYNHRMIIDSPLYSDDGENRAWLISKVNRISPHGIARITLAQDVYDQHHDYIERDEDGNVIGMWANYFDSDIAPVTIDEDENVYARITCSGRPQMKIGGTAKTFTIDYLDANGDPIPDHTIGYWQLFFGENRVSNNLVELEYFDNKMKVRFLGDDSYIGTILTVTNTLGSITTSLDVEILPL